MTTSCGPDRSHIATGPDAIGSDLVDLRCNLRTRYGLPAERERTVLEFEALARWCGPELVVIRSLRQDEPVGFVICLRRDETLYARTAGFDYDRLGPKDFCYFNVVYYDALEWGLPRGVRRFELGLAYYPAKRTRGCHFEQPARRVPAAGRRVVALRARAAGPGRAGAVDARVRNLRGRHR